MEMDHLLLFVTLALLAEILGTIGGFGSSLYFVPIAGFFLDFYSVLGVTAVFHVFSNLAKISMFRHGFDKRIILTVGVPAMAFVMLGAALTHHVDVSVLQLVLSVFLIVLSLVFIIFRKLQVKPNLFNSLTGGALSGFTAGLLGSGGAIRGLTLAAFNIEKNVFISTSALIDLGVDLGRSGVYFSNGYIHRHDVYLIVILLGVSFAGTFAGKKILGRFSENDFRTLVLSLIFLIGLVSFLTTFYK